jgi:hypothetical protein
MAAEIACGGPILLTQRVNRRESRHMSAALGSGGIINRDQYKIDPLLMILGLEQLADNRQL